MAKSKKKGIKSKQRKKRNRKAKVLAAPDKKDPTPKKRAPKTMVASAELHH